MKTLLLPTAQKMCEKYGFDFVPSVEAINEHETVQACQRMGFPTVIKAVCDGISHKTEKGAVKTNIASAEQARAVFLHMQKLPGFRGVVVQKMLEGTEVIIGGKRDEQFGPTIIFGMGGIYVEILDDVVVGICPVSRKEAKRMLGRLKTLKIMTGARGKHGANIRELESLLLRASRMMLNEKNLIELDINPLMITPRGIIAVDCRAVVE